MGLDHDFLNVTLLCGVMVNICQSCQYDYNPSFPKSLYANFAYVVFTHDSEFNIRKVIASYLKRSSWVVDRLTGDRRKVEKKFDSKTAPQGSSLSPTLWRLFDALFSRMYTNALDRAVGGTILEYKHVAYADDHLTVVGLAVPADASHEMISALVRGVILGIRDALDTATRSAAAALT